MNGDELGLKVKQDNQNFVCILEISRRQDNIVEVVTRRECGRAYGSHYMKVSAQFI